MVMSCWHHSRITSCPLAPTSPLMNSFFLVEERQKSRKRTVSSTWNRCLAVSTTVRILLMTPLLFCCLLLNGLSCILRGRTSEPCLPGAPLPSMSSFFQTPKKGLEIQSLFKECEKFLFLSVARNLITWLAENRLFTPMCWQNPT